MDDNERERYLKLKDLNAHLLNQLSEGQIELERLNTRKTELEEELVTSPVNLSYSLYSTNLIYEMSISL
ncbi:unnamed protein product [Trichobilharzia regenti]|nr:unnamed protein product [Trichobilharzia regenti]